MDNSVKATNLCHIPWKMCRITEIKKRKVNFGFKLQTEITSIKQKLDIICMFPVMLFQTAERKKNFRAVFCSLFPLPYPKICIVSGKKWQNIMPYLKGVSTGFLSQGWSLACPMHWQCPSDQNGALDEHPKVVAEEEQGNAVMFRPALLLNKLLIKHHPCWIE